MIRSSMLSFSWPWWTVRCVEHGSTPRGEDRMQDGGLFPCPYCDGASYIRVPVRSLLPSFGSDSLVEPVFAEYERTAIQWGFRDCSGAGWCWVRKG